MLLIFDIGTSIENECLKIVTTLPNVLILSINAGLKLCKLMISIGKLFAKNK